METSNPGVMGLLVQKMNYLSQRQSVLAENVANVDTPKYKAHDLAPFTFGDALKQANVGMAVTNPAHIVPASMAGVNAKSLKAKSDEITLSGNSVDIAHEMTEVSKTAIEYKELTSVLKKFMGLFRIALRGN